MDAIKRIRYGIKILSAQGFGGGARNEHIGDWMALSLNIPSSRTFYILIVLVSLSLVKSKGQRLTVYMEEMWEG